MKFMLQLRTILNFFLNTVLCKAAVFLSKKTQLAYTVMGMIFPYKAILGDRNMNIEIFGTAERMKTLATLALDFISGHAVLLPVPSTKDGTHISGTDITLDETLGAVGGESVVVGYNLPLWYKEKAERLGARILDLSLDEKFMKANAYTTAVGALLYIMETEKRQPSDLSFAVVGYGRIGSLLSELLLFMGAALRVYTKREKVALELCGSGVFASDEIYRGRFSKEGIDILINTAPCDLSGAFVHKKIPDDLRVLELASGENFKGVFGVERLPALPDRFFPKSAALAYLGALKDFVERGDKA